jgi:hypothetical protein
VSPLEEIVFGKVLEANLFFFSRIDIWYLPVESWQLTSVILAPWEDRGSNPISKKPFILRGAGRVAQGVDPEFKPLYHKKKKKEKKNKSGKNTELFCKS